MKTVAIILAGGVGSRMGESIPKQFLLINEKPVIVHTIENFQKNELVDSVLVVCVKEHISHLQDLVVQYNLSKVEWIIEGGTTGHDSTRNGIFFLQDKLTDEDYIIVHDSVRPIIPQQAINEMLKVAFNNGNASLAIPCHETVIFTEDGLSGTKDLDRKSIMRVQTPQAYRFKPMLELYQKAEKEDKHDFIYADLVLIHYGKRVYFSKGFTNNIKITRKEDIPLCKSLMTFSEEELFNS